MNDIRTMQIAQARWEYEQQLSQYAARCVAHIWKSDFETIEAEESAKMELASDRIDKLLSTPAHPMIHYHEREILREEWQRIVSEWFWNCLQKQLNFTLPSDTVADEQNTKTESA